VVIRETFAHTFVAEHDQEVDLVAELASESAAAQQPFRWRHMREVELLSCNNLPGCVLERESSTKLNLKNVAQSSVHAMVSSMCVLCIHATLVG
jgi:hypothetical protein